ncbi:MAG: OadG family transporter subunit [Bacteroidales bacterium]|jgi:uncharacterized membrane protein|nr:OadG family transporter subunit [Bacteroidales bacterium]
MSLSILLINWNFAISLSVIGYLIVLSALLFLFLIYLLIPRVIQFVTKQYLRKKADTGDEEFSELPVTGEVSAAISAALYLFLNEQHDAESGKITIKEVSRKYSPWSSKIYGMRQPLTK